MARGNRPGICADCKEFRKSIAGRRLCTTCWKRNKDADTLIDWPRVIRQNADVIEDWNELRMEGYTRAQAAERMGMSRNALDKHIERWKGPQGMNKPKDWVVDAYFKLLETEPDLSIAKAAKRIGCHRWTLEKWLKRWREQETRSAA